MFQIYELDNCLAIGMPGKDERIVDKGPYKFFYALNITNGLKKVPAIKFHKSFDKELINSIKEHLSTLNVESLIEGMSKIEDFLQRKINDISLTGIIGEVFFLYKQDNIEVIKNYSGLFSTTHIDVNGKDSIEIKSTTLQLPQYIIKFNQLHHSKPDKYAFVKLIKANDGISINEMILHIEDKFKTKFPSLNLTVDIIENYDLESFRINESKSTVTIKDTSDLDIPDMTKFKSVISSKFVYNLDYDA